MEEWNHSATPRRPHRFLTARPDSAGPTEPDSAEFDEFDVWGGGGGGSGAVESLGPSEPVRAPRRRPERVADRVTYPQSLPVSVPQWAVRLPEDEAGRGWVVGGDGESPGGEGTGGGFVPPHELLLRRCRAASFSVQEGLGRTLKGRDLSRVRNAVWAKIGFED